MDKKLRCAFVGWLFAEPEESKDVENCDSGNHRDNKEPVFG